MSGFDNTLKQTSINAIVNLHSDYMLTSTIAKINASAMTSEQKTSAIAGVNASQLKDNADFIHSVSSVVNQIYSDIQTQLLTKLVVSIPNFVTSAQIVNDAVVLAKETVNITTPNISFNA